MTALKQLHFSFYPFPAAIPNGLGERAVTWDIYIHFWRISHFQLYEPLSAISERVTPPPRDIVFMIFVKFSPERAHLYFFRYLGGWGVHGTRVATWHFTEMINYIGIFTQILEVHPKNFLFGREMCTNGHVIFKISSEPCRVQVLWNIENIIFCLPFQISQKRKNWSWP